MLFYSCHLALCAVCVLSVGSLGCAGAAASSSAETATTGSVSKAAAAPLSGEQIVAAADREQEDRALDDGRKPAALLDFLSLSPGAHVLDIGAGRGYTTELLARAVGPTGVVHSQNPKSLPERIVQSWSARLAKPVNASAVRVERDFDDPIPEEARGTLDAVVDVLFYHDTVWLGTDRAKMNASIFAALKPGGEYVIVDHNAAADHGVADVKALHRIEEQVVRQEVEAAGFVLVAAADFLRNPGDARDWSASPSAAGEQRGHSDRFVLKFRRPPLAQ